MNRLSKGKQVTAAQARKITGFSLGPVGLQWADPGPSATDVVRRFLIFLEDRRVLYNPHHLEVESQVEHSIHQIREECTKALALLAADSTAAFAIRAIRQACRRYHDEQHERFRHFDRSWHQGDGSPGFFMALGAFRAIVGHQVAVLAAAHNLDVEGDLASILPDIGDETP